MKLVLKHKYYIATVQCRQTQYEQGYIRNSKISKADDQFKKKDSVRYHHLTIKFSQQFMVYTNKY